MRAQGGRGVRRADGRRRDGALTLLFRFERGIPLLDLVHALLVPPALGPRALQVGLELANAPSRERRLILQRFHPRECVPERVGDVA